MIPIIVSPEKARIGLAGTGDALARRRALLTEAGVEPVEFALDGVWPLDSLRLLFLAGGEPQTVERLTQQARALGILVNVEDVPELCDFHVPAILRRGDLLLCASTGGKAPGLSKLIREWLDARFGPQWAYNLDNLSHRRAQWRAEGIAPSEVSRRTREFVDAKGWL